MDMGKDSLYRAALKSTQVAIILYVIIKQVYFVALFAHGYLLERTVANVVLLAIAFGLPHCGQAVRRNISWLIPTAVVFTEMAATWTYGGDQSIYVILSGCALLSLLFADIRSLAITIAASWLAAFIGTFVVGFNMMGPLQPTEYNYIHFTGLTLSFIVIFFVGKFSIGSLDKSRRTAEAAVESMKAAQRENERMTAKIETMLNNLPGMVIQCTCHFPDYIYTFVSEGCKELTGYMPEELTSTALSFLDIIHPDDVERVNKLSEETLLSGLPFEGTFRIRTKDGSVKWIWERSRITERNPDGSPHLLEGYYTDVSESKRLEAAEAEYKAKIVEINENMMLILDTMPIGIRVVAMNNGELLYANKALAEARGGGESKEDIMGRNVYDFLPEMQPNGRPTVEILNEFAESGNPIIELQCKKFDGELYMASLTSRVFNYMGRPSTLVTMEDITEKNKMAESMRRAELAEASSHAKSQFLAMMSHEIRTPMNSIMGFAELAQGSEKIAQIKNYLGKISDGTKWLLNIVNGILDISKIESGKVELEQSPFNLQEIFARCQSVILPAVKEKGLDLSVYVEPIPGRKLIGDQVRLYQVLMNLLSNAVKFTEMGTAKFSSTLKHVDDSSATIYFEVKDTGIGMTPEQIGRIFEPFVQADSSTTRTYGGTGLGLTITKNLVELMGGKLTVDSALGVGSTFSFELSFETVETSEDLSEREYQNLIHKPLFDALILVCDDNPMNREVICEHLARVGIRTDFAENGKEGIDKVVWQMEQDTEAFDLIFMDMFMPVMDGMEAASKINALNTGVPIVAMTANIMGGELEKYKKNGMPDCLSKPFTSQELWRILLKYLTPISSGPADADEGNVALQKKLRIDFFKNNQVVHDEITKAVAEGDTKRAHRLAHTLKGNAGLVGKPELRLAAEEVEQILRNGVDAIWDSKMGRLKTELAAVLSEFRTLLDEDAATEQEETTPLTAQQTQELFDRLAQMLENVNPESLTLLAELRAVPGTEELARQIENYEFEDAARTLGELRQ